MWRAVAMAVRWSMVRYCVSSVGGESRERIRGRHVSQRVTGIPNPERSSPDTAVTVRFDELLLYDLLSTWPN